MVDEKMEEMVSPEGADSLKEEKPVFTVIKARWIVLILAVIFIGFPVAVAFLVVESSLLSYDDQLVVLCLGFIPYFLLCLFLFLGCWKAGVVRRFSFGPRVGLRRGISFALLGIPLVGVSFFCLYLVFLPLSYVAPDIVQFLILRESAFLSLDGVLATILSFLLIVVVAPIVEELVFRGFLLNRLNVKYGPRRAIFFSALLFSLLHANVLGVFVLGVVLAIVQLRTRTLVTPILIHVGNNLFASLYYLVAVTMAGASSPSMADFRDGWWLGVAGAVIGIPWLYWFFQTRLTTASPVEV